MPRVSAISVDGQVHVVVEHHDGAVLHGKSSEGALELVPIVDVAQRVGRVRWVEHHQARSSRTPGSSPLSLAVALPDEDPVRPGLEAGRVAELRKVAPDAQQRLLRRILGEVDVAQDPVRDGEEPVAHADSKERECLFVALLRPGHETRIHPFPSCGARFDALSQGYGGRGPANGAVFVGPTEQLLRSADQVPGRLDTGRALRRQVDRGR